MTTTRHQVHDQVVLAGDDVGDALRPARGIMNALLIAVPVDALIAALIVWVLR